MPADVIEAVLDTGARMDMQQLAAAARCRVLGLEAWVKVCKTMRVKSGLPAVVESVCTAVAGDRLSFSSRQVTAANVQDLLHIAVNKSDTTAASQLLTFLRLPRSSKGHAALLQQLTPALLLHLLCTAVERQHVCVVEQLLRLPAVQQLQPADVAAVVQAALTPGRSMVMLTALCKPPLSPLLDAANCESSIAAAMLANSASVAHHGVALLCSCAAARALPPAALARLLAAALTAYGGDALKGYCSHMLVLPLLGLPGAQALPAVSVAALLRQALSCVSHPLSRLESFRFLLSLPAAGSMDQATLAGVLQATLQDAAYPAALAMCEQLSGMQLLDAATISSLLQTIIQQSGSISYALGGDLDADADGDPEGLVADVPVINKLCELPAAALLDPEPLIRQAVQLRALRVLPCLCRQLQLSVSSLTAMLQSAAHDKEYGVLKLLLASAAAQQLSRESLAQLLECTVEAAEEDAAVALLQLPAAQQLEVGTAAALLDCAVKQQCCRQLSPQRLQALLLHATQQHNDNSVEILSQMAAAHSISHESVEQIMTAAIRVGCCGMLMDLCELAGAETLPADAVCRLLRTALNLQWTEASQIEETLDLALRMRACGDQAVVRLLDLPGAQQLSSSSVSLLLQQAGQHGAKQAVVRLCELPGAQHLGPDAAAAALSFGVVEQLDSPAIVALSGLPGPTHEAAAGLVVTISSQQLIAGAAKLQLSRFVTVVD
ncbi:hypothetical protein OEZ85_002017 [Tetradesmus obliquus]|uniref:Uncharacterized protein n=1 Tax=Tetradesmus obliquus TaxID=3088 RepID=A0ABY8U1N2_TETOB|nr:hypothetical protein OEZ85_002017 [Tetradesmus obliquus]